jgi:NAD(P)H-nitrite reductase large subunit/ferredoxin
MALRCEQCEEPLCAYACKSGALRRDVGTGALALDPAQCVSCWMCLMVCPHGVRLDPGHDAIVRCDVCAERALPACVAACPTRALQVTSAPVQRWETDFTGHVVVVGSSAAGLAACEAAREHAPGCSITLVTADERPTYSRPLLAYVLARTIEAGRLDWRPSDYLEGALGVRVLRGARAAAVRSGAVELADGRVVSFDRLVIATGARPVRLDVPGSDLAGVHGVRDAVDLEAIERLATPGARAVVLGGGNVGLQICEALLARGALVTVVVRSPCLLSQMVDAEVGRRVGDLFAAHGLTLRLGRDVVAVAGAGRVTAVTLDDGETLPADLVVVGKGIAPNVEWLRGSGIAVGRGITVDVSGRTNVPGVFAAGDCAEVPDVITGQPAVSGLWPVAYEMGRVAGSTAVGVARAAPGALRLNASRFFDVPIIAIGEVVPTRVPGATAHVLTRTTAVSRTLVLGGGRLVGALLYGDITGAGIFYRLYRDGVDLGAITMAGLTERRVAETLGALLAT